MSGAVKYLSFMLMILVKITNSEGKLRFGIKREKQAPHSYIKSGRDGSRKRAD